MSASQISLPADPARGGSGAGRQPARFCDIATKGYLQSQQLTSLSQPVAVVVVVSAEAWQQRLVDTDEGRSTFIPTAPMCWISKV